MNEWMNMSTYEITYISSPLSIVTNKIRTTWACNWFLVQELMNFNKWNNQNNTKHHKNRYNTIVRVIGNSFTTEITSKNNLSNWWRLLPVVQICLFNYLNLVSFLYNDIKKHPIIIIFSYGYIYTTKLTYHVTVVIF